MEEKISTDTEPKVSYSIKEAVKLPAIAHFPKPLESYLDKAWNNEIVYPNNIMFDVHSFRILLILVGMVKAKQIQKATQLNLFDNDWFSTIKESNNQVQFNFKIKNLVPPNSRNYKEAKNGLSFLVQFVTKQNFLINDKQVTFESSLINNLIYNDGEKGVKFDMHNYWYRILLNISNGYNQFPTESIFKISFSAYYFYFFLLTLVHRDKATGLRIAGSTQLKMETINQKYKTNYKYWSKIREKILDPIKIVLDKYSDLSFNYNIEGNKCNIVSYFTASSVPQIMTDSDYRIVKAIGYKRKKHTLDEIEVAFLSNFYKKYGYDTVTAAISRKEILKNLKGRQYLEELHGLLKIYLDKRDGIMKKQSETS